MPTPTPTPTPAATVFTPTSRSYDSARADAIKGSAEYAGATQSPNRIALGTDTSDATGGQHPFTRTKVYVAYGYGLTGAGVKVGVVDDGFNLVNGEPQHNEFTSANKIVKLTSTAPLVGSRPTDTVDEDAQGAHGAHVSGLAVADRNGTSMMGVAYGAQLYLGMSPSYPNQFEALFNEYTAQGVTVSSNSYGIPVLAGAWNPVATSTSGGLEVTARNALAYRDANGLNSAQMMAAIIGDAQTTTTVAQWTAEIAAIKSFQNAGGVVVWANSNYGQNAIDNGAPGLNNSDLGGSLPLAFPEISGGWILVTNATSVGLAIKENGQQYVDTSSKKEGNIFLNSAQCGISANFCVSMDGVAMRSAGSKGVSNYVVQTGTSQATPQVAGMLALLRQAFPTASAADLAARLMYTADNGFFTGTNRTISVLSTASYTNANGTITHAVSDIWGHGFPDLQSALNPVGSVTVRTRSGSVAPLASVGTLQVSGAMGTGAQLATTTYLFNDVLNGVFARSLGANVASTGDTRITEAFGGARVEQAMTEVQTPKGLTMRFGLATVPDAGADRARVGTLFSLTQRVGRQAMVGMGYGFSPDTMLGLRPRSAGLRSASLQDRAMGIPFLALGSPIGQTWAAAGLRSGTLRATIAAFGSGSGERAARLRSPLANRGRTQGFVVDATAGREGGPWQLNLSLGQTRERDGILGAQMSDASFASGPADSRFLRAAFSTRLVGAFSLQGNYVTALTRVRPAAGSLIGGYSPMRSEAASLALVGEGLFGRGTLLTLGVAQPLRVASGRATLDLPQAVMITAPGEYSYLYADKGVRLTPGGREIDYTVEFTRRLGQRTSLRVAGMAMSQPRHDATADTGFAGLVSLKTAF